MYRNIGACKELAQTTRSAYGPNGMNKMVINHIDKLFVTNDAATILKELEVVYLLQLSLKRDLLLLDPLLFKYILYLVTIHMIMNVIKQNVTITVLYKFCFLLKAEGIYAILMACVCQKFSLFLNSKPL